MLKKRKRIVTPNLMPQITLLLSQFLFLVVLISSFSRILGASFSSYARVLSPLHSEGGITSFHD